MRVDDKMKSKKLRVLNLTGSAESDYYANLSLAWARGAADNLEKSASKSIEFVYAFVYPCIDSNKNNNSSNSNNNKNKNTSLIQTDIKITDALWSFPINFEKNNLSKAERISYKDAIIKLKSLDIDGCIPIMFDNSGTTIYRDLLDDLNIAYIGSNSNTMQLSNNKHLCKLELSKYGVNTPNGILITRNDIDSNNNEFYNGIVTRLGCPLVVKPCCEDNSIGLSYVEDVSGLKKGILDAFRYDDQVLVEQYIKLGKEIRMALIEIENEKENENNNNRESEYIILPCMEYKVVNKIRETQDKWITNNVESKDFDNAENVIHKSGNVIMNSNRYYSDELNNKLRSLCIHSHKALNCKDYSLFDIRIDENDNPYLIEANLFWAFSKESIITTMVDSMPISKRNSNSRLSSLFETLIKQAIQRKEKQQFEKKYVSKL